MTKSIGTMTRNVVGLALMTALLPLSPSSRAEDVVDPGESEEFPLHHAGVFLGAVTETGCERDATDWALGLEYEYRPVEKFGVGVLIEMVGGEADREFTALLTGIMHPGGGWRVVLAPGVEIDRHERHTAFLLRVGMGYEFVFQGGYTVGPEFNIDFIENSHATFVYGVVLGKEF